MSFITTVIQQTAENNCTLRATHKITEQDIKVNPNWAFIKKDYEALVDHPWKNKALVSLVNSIIYQQRKVFILTRASLRELLDSDENWEKPLGLKNENYPIFLANANQLIEITEKIKTSKGRTVYIYRVKHPTLLALLEAKTEAEQLSQCIDLLKKKETPKSLPSGAKIEVLEQEAQEGLEKEVLKSEVLSIRDVLAHYPKPSSTNVQTIVKALGANCPGFNNSPQTLNEIINFYFLKPATDKAKQYKLDMEENFRKNLDQYFGSLKPLKVSEAQIGVSPFKTFVHDPEDLEYIEQNFKFEGTEDDLR